MRMTLKSKEYMGGLKAEVKSLYFSLRGGGGSASRQQINDATQIQSRLPLGFGNQMQNYFRIIIDKAQLAQDDDQKQEILIAIQWCLAMKEHFNNICINTDLNSSCFDLILEYFPQLLKSILIYFRISGFLCLQILQIINDLARIIFSYFINNDKRFFKKKDKESLLNLIDDLEIQLDIEALEIWKQLAKIEIELIKAAVYNSPGDPNEKQELLISFLQGSVKSVLTMAASSELIDSLIGGAKYFYKFCKTRNLLQKYEIYYYFEKVKWNIINLLNKGENQSTACKILNQTYEKYINNNDDWLVNFCWVKMIAFLISYRPSIRKSECSQNLIDQTKRWNLLKSNKLVNLFSFDKENGKLLIAQKCNHQEALVLDEIIAEFQFQQLQFFLINSLRIISVNPKCIFTLNYEQNEQQQEMSDLKIYLNGVNSLQNLLKEANQQIQQLEKSLKESQKEYENFRPKENNQAKQKMITNNIRNLSKQFSLCLNFLSKTTKVIKIYFEISFIVYQYLSEIQQSSIAQQILDLQSRINEFCESQNEKFSKLKEQISVQFAHFEVFCQLIPSQFDQNKYQEISFKIIIQNLNELKQQGYEEILEKLQLMSNKIGDLQTKTPLKLTSSVELLKLQELSKENTNPNSIILSINKTCTFLEKKDTTFSFKIQNLMVENLSQYYVVEGLIDSAQAFENFLFEIKRILQTNLEKVDNKLLIIRKNSTTKSLEKTSDYLKQYNMYFL